MTATDDLIALASSYYPAIGDPDMHTPAAWRREFASAPETKALRRKQQHAATNHAKWRSFVVGLHKALPDHRVRDESRIELDASYAALITVPSDEPYNRLLVLYASFIAPVYLRYELQEVSTPDGKFERLTRFDEPSDEARAAVTYIDRELPRQFGIERIAPDISRIIVPHVAMDNLGPGEVTLADALFSEQRRESLA